MVKADMGFIGVQRFLTPYKQHNLLVPLSAEQSLHNRKVNRLRWRVEESFLRCKRWRFFSLHRPAGRWYGWDTTYGLYCLSCMVQNWIVEH